MGPLEVRADLASKYLSGEGIEIGALNNPMPVPPTAFVRYVDRHSYETLRNQDFPELHASSIATVDIIDDAETLATIPDASLDFVIINHVIEHCKNTIKALRTFWRVLKPGGLLFMTAPDKRYTFDRDRPLTTLEHIKEDDRENSPARDLAHYDEYVRLVDKVTDPKAYLARMAYLLGINYSIHFHVWDWTSFSAMMDYVSTQLPMEIVVAQEDGQYENIFIIKKVVR